MLYGGVSQLVTASGCDPDLDGFDSRTSPQRKIENMELKRFQFNNIIPGSNVWFAREISPGKYEEIELWNNIKKKNIYLYQFVEKTDMYLLRIRKFDYMSYEYEIYIYDFPDDIIIDVRQECFVSFKVNDYVRKILIT